jgi:hypothetical protein
MVMLTEQMKKDLTTQGFDWIPCFDCKSAQTILANGDDRAILCTSVNLSLQKNPVLHNMYSAEVDSLRTGAKTAVIFTHPDFKSFVCNNKTL